MNNPTEKRRGLKNAIERLKAEGVRIELVSANSHTPLITVEFPPIWLMSNATKLRERINGTDMTTYIAKLSGCLVRWIEDDLPESYRIAQHLNPYAPESIAQWPANL